MRLWTRVPSGGAIPVGSGVGLTQMLNTPKTKWIQVGTVRIIIRIYYFKGDLSLKGVYRRDGSMTTVERGIEISNHTHLKCQS